MIGIQREYVKEMIAEYREKFPEDKREDWLIGEALQAMRRPENYCKHLRQWVNRQVFENQDTFETIKGK